MRGAAHLLPLRLSTTKPVVAAAVVWRRAQLPLPVALPGLPHLKSESEDSEDNYEATQAKIQKILDKQAARGRPMPPTVEEEDLEDLDDFDKEVAGARKTPRVSRKTRKGMKGKGKATSVDSTDDEEAADSDNDDDGDNKLHKVAALAKECGKSPNTLHQLVGSVIKTTCASSPWNIYQQWHAETHLKATEMSTKDYNTLACDSFKTTCTDELNDPDAVYTAIPWLKEWHHKLMTNATLQWWDNGKFEVKVQKGMQPIVQQCRLMYGSFGVHVWGFVIDPDGQASFMSGATDEFKAVRTEMMKLKRRGGLNSELGPTVVGLMTGDVEEKEGEAACNMFRHVLGNILSHQLELFGVARSIVEPQKNKKFKMMWGPKLLDFLFKARCRVVNYPPALEDIGQQMGGSFNLKKISLVTYKAFAPAMQKANQQMQEGKELGEDVMEILLWDLAEMAQSLKDQLDIAPVTAMKSRPQRRRESVARTLALAPALPPGLRLTFGPGCTLAPALPPAPGRTHAPAFPPTLRLAFGPGRTHAPVRLAPVPPTSSLTPVVNHIAATAVLAPIPPTPSPTPMVNHIATTAVPNLQAGRMPPTLWDMEHPQALVLVVNVITGTSTQMDVLTLGTVTSTLSARCLHALTFIGHTPRHTIGATLLLLATLSSGLRGAFTKNPLGCSLSPTPHAGSLRAGHSEVHCPRKEVHDERPHQSSWEENPDAAAPLYKCRYNVKALTQVFYAKGLQRTERNARADRATIICREGQEYGRLQAGLTPILALLLDTERYYKEIVTHRLEG
ncbi:hypothetical protein DFH09DRAFT_1318783 [Mycena vulgaris]|nr:hypothetical protein DFH09DRAFT_1318783 [Mycena vulgaris]